MNIILFGFKGCGKTHFGKRLATTLNRLFIDTDTILEELYAKEFKQRLKPREIYQTLGDPGFRALERSAIATLVNIDGAVIALGGGTVLDPQNAEALLKIGRLVYLDVDFEVIRQRLKEVPAFAKTDSLQAIYHARKPLYESLPAHKIITDLLNEEEVLTELQKVARRNVHMIERFTLI